jgi:general nucleoside transport system ATP-binding protein
MKIEIKNIHKRFGPVHANNAISTVFGEGRIIGILGENGAGKSTLMKILSGFQPADEGEIWMNDKHVDYHGPLAAIAHGVGMLQQDPLDVGAFSVLENFTYGQVDKPDALSDPTKMSDKLAKVLDAVPGGWMVGELLSYGTVKKAARVQLQELCDRVGFDLNPDLPIHQLSVAQRQQLEIIRLLAFGVQTLILDEPTTGISAEQKAQLFETLRDLAHQDKMTVLLVSHKLEDVIALCDEVRVLRAGEMIGSAQMPATKTELVTMMFGQQLAAKTRERRDLSGEPVRLELSNICLTEGRITIDDFSLRAYAGEIIGFAGLDGNGQQVIMRAATGLLPCEKGRVRVNDADMTGNAYRNYMRNSVIYGASGRLEEGLIAGLTLTEHIALVREQGRFIDWEQARMTTTTQIQQYDVRGRATDNIEQLSGGNQQRVLMALLPDEPTALVLEQPTRGLDVDSARWIWEQLLTRAATGAAILFSSAELDELVTYSDRIVVCFAGQTVIVNDPGSITINELGHLIGGAFEDYRSAHREEGAI